MLTLGTGIGGGLFLGGEVYRGCGGGGAEMGHMVVEMDGRSCGNSSRLVFRGKMTGPRHDVRSLELVRPPSSGVASELIARRT